MGIPVQQVYDPDRFKRKNPIINFTSLSAYLLTRDSSVGIATRYQHDGPGFESPWEDEIFRTRPDRPCGPTNLLFNGYRVIPADKVAEYCR